MSIHMDAHTHSRIHIDMQKRGVGKMETRTLPLTHTYKHTYTVKDWYIQT